MWRGSRRQRRRRLRRRGRYCGRLDRHRLYEHRAYLRQCDRHPSGIRRPARPARHLRYRWHQRPRNRHEWKRGSRRLLERSGVRSHASGWVDAPRRAPPREGYDPASPAHSRSSAARTRAKDGRSSRRAAGSRAKDPDDRATGADSLRSLSDSCASLWRDERSPSPLVSRACDCLLYTSASSSSRLPSSPGKPSGPGPRVTA